MSIKISPVSGGTGENCNTNVANHIYYLHLRNLKTRSVNTKIFIPNVIPADDLIAINEIVLNQNKGKYNVQFYNQGKNPGHVNFCLQVIQINW